MSSFEPQPHDESLGFMLEEFFNSEMPEEVRNRQCPPALKRVIAAKELHREALEVSRHTANRRSRFRSLVGFSTVAVACIVAIVWVQNRAPVLVQQNSGSDVSRAEKIEPSAPRSASLTARLEEQPSSVRRTESSNFANRDVKNRREAVVAGVAGSGVSALLTPLLASPTKPQPDRNNYGYRVSEEYEPIVSNPKATRSLERRARVRTTNVSFFEPHSGSQIEMELPELEIEILAATPVAK